MNSTTAFLRAKNETVLSFNQSKVTDGVLSLAERSETFVVFKCHLTCLPQRMKVVAEKAGEEEDLAEVQDGLIEK